MDISELKQKANLLDPVLRIGKNGMNDSIYQEIDKLLRKRKLIKIKLLNNSPVEDVDELIITVVEKTNSVLVSKVGNVFTIYRERTPRGEPRS
ncbi:MAG: YhbY family RNA-binding protein [Nanoarchaeota archaeon]|nr:YhbY family RNA-binding protein [Nanoarchaeota archaeon]